MAKFDHWLGDPTFNPAVTSGTGVYDSVAKTITDTSKSWTPDQLTGLLVSSNSSRWHVAGNTATTIQLGTWYGGGATPASGAYSIASDPAKFGWLRSTPTKSPYSWESATAKYLYQYWDPTTPPPLADWTKTSIMLVPKAGNPYQGKQATHEWQGFKRWYYVFGNVGLSAGQSVVQHYMIQLGTRNSSVLPDLTSATRADPFANDYLNPATPSVAKGTLIESGYDASEAAYVFSADNNQLAFSLDGATYARIRPAFKVQNYNSTRIPTVTLNGQTKEFGKDFTAAMLNSSTLLVHLQTKVTANATFSIREGSSDFPEIDNQAP